ncbi:MAG: MAPEG family protein [Myxococcota bacterium]
MNLPIEVDLMADAAVRAWAAATLVVLLKMMAVGVYTSVLRIRKHVYISPEDFEMQGQPVVETPDEDIERARRIHRNDLENVLLFAIVGFVYALCEPSSLGLRVCFVGFPVARILHTFFYARGLMPHRTLAFTFGFGITAWMTLSSLVHLLMRDG